MKTKGEKLALRLGNMAPNKLTPDTYREILHSEFEDYSLVIDETDYETADLVGIRAINAGSLTVGHLSEMYPWRQLRCKETATVALVGKGITFDSGGYSIKGSHLMHHMKYDMLGSAFVLGALVDTGFPKHAVGELCVAENRVSSRAIVPGHEITYPNGQKAVIEDTDAEGRVVLADGILRAVSLGIKTIITVATLTGAIQAALGKNTVGVFSTSDALAEITRKVFESSKINGWRMPFLERDCLKALKRPGGILSNYTENRGIPGASMAATFLKQFVPEGVNLVHLDVAGVAWNDKGPRTEMVEVLSKLIGVLK